MNFRKSLVYILVLMMIVGMSGCQSKQSNNTTENTANKERITVAVSIIPQETFAKAVAGDLVDVITMIPPGHSPANYQPTPKQMTKFSESKAYFSIGVPTEESNILPKVEDLNKDIKIVSLADKVGEVYSHRSFAEEEEHQHDEENHKDRGDEEHHHHDGRDPHIWLSPKRAKVMVEVIKDELVLLDPDNKTTYEKNAEEYIAQLDEADNEIREVLSDFNGQSFIIYHPAFGYFADDYGLKMVTIEEDGKESTAKKLQEVIDFAKRENIKFVFYQEEFDSNQAETIAKEIGGKTIKVAPLASDYIENLKSIANKFKEILE